MQSNQNGNRIDIILRELIATISDVVFENSDDEKEAHDIARLVLVEILKDTALKSEFVDRPVFWN